MIFKYRISKECHKAILQYDWIKANYSLDKEGQEDEHEIVRLLDNTHYKHISELLKFINQYCKSGSITISV